MEVLMLLQPTPQITGRGLGVSNSPHSATLPSNPPMSYSVHQNVQVKVHDEIQEFSLAKTSWNMSQPIHALQI